MRPTTLTARQIEVLTLVARGLTNKEIARELRISRATVRNHLVAIYRRLGVCTRTGAAIKAVTTGLIQLKE